MINLPEVFRDNMEGVFTMSGGEVSYSMARRYDDGSFALRYESGWWVSYRDDGVRPIAGSIYSSTGELLRHVPGGDKRNIVAFEPMNYADAMRKYPGIGDGFGP